MLRRRAGFLGKMALEVAYQCLGQRIDVPTVFSSRHGELCRSVVVGSREGRATCQQCSAHRSMLATCGLFSIARGDHANNVALAAGKSTIEHAVIEACGLLAEVSLQCCS